MSRSRRPDAAARLERLVRLPARGDAVARHHRREPTRRAQDPGTIQTPIYVKAVELMGASPTPMAFGEVYTSLQTGVIDRYEHDANTTMQQRFYEIAGFMARTGLSPACWAVGVDRDAGSPAPRPAFRARERRPRGGTTAPRAGTRRGRGGDRATEKERHDRPRDRSPPLAAGGRAALGDRGARAGHTRVARGDWRCRYRPAAATAGASPADRMLQWAIAILVVAQAAVVGLQVVGRHILHRPIPGPRRSRASCWRG